MPRCKAVPFFGAGSPAPPRLSRQIWADFDGSEDEKKQVERTGVFVPPVHHNLRSAGGSGI